MAIRRDLFSLIPAHAGVIPSAMTATPGSTTYPRARGGDPIQRPGEKRHAVLSPRTRG